MVELEWTWYIDENNELRPIESVYNKIYSVMNELKKEGNIFAGKIDRLNFTIYSCVIKYNNEPIGFIYATPEGRYDYALFIDMAILKEYRGKGFGKQALKQFSEIKTKKFLIAETKDNGTLGEGIAVKIFEDKYNYYLLPRSRYKEFMEFNKDMQFEKAILEENNQYQLIKKK